MIPWSFCMLKIINDLKKFGGGGRQKWIHLQTATAMFNLLKPKILLLLFFCSNNFFVLANIKITKKLVYGISTLIRILEIIIICKNFIKSIYLRWNIYK